jgi:hypothetical protein
MTAGPAQKVNSRFKVIQPGNFPFPGKCVVCGKIDQPLLDFGASEFNYGAIMFCQTCFSEGIDAFAVEGVEVPLSPSVEEYRIIADELRSSLDEYVPNLLSVLNASNGLLSSLPSLQQPSAEQDDNADGGDNSAAGSSADNSANKSAGDERPASVSGRGSNGARNAPGL